jgi:hypothetical protein
MQIGNVFPLASLAAVRPVFWIVMGIFLLVIAWRISCTSSPWTRRFLLAGAMLLGCGYAILLPLYETGHLERFAKGAHYHGSETTAMVWHAIKMLVMNTGWLLLGIGLAMHAKVFTAPAPPHRKTPALPPAAPHELTP